jgi:GT2 family glycosyltransferase
VSEGADQRRPPVLSASIVVFHPDLDLLRSTLRALAAAIRQARETGALSTASVLLVDNGSQDEAVVDALLQDSLNDAAPVDTITLRGHGNVGYGRGHDLAIERSAADYHLVLNPDVVMAPSALAEGLDYLERRPDIGLLTPHVVNDRGGREFLCKRYPSVGVLALRGFAPAWLRRPFRRRLERYEMRDLPEHEIAEGVPIATGCFMLARRSALQAVGSFSPDYFLYFEDFDLSLRLHRVADIAYVPAVRITHSGGNAARKGWSHRRMFLRSALTFFRQHGWKLW